jgi:hypothetical protein
MRTISAYLSIILGLIFAVGPAFGATKLYVNLWTPPTLTWAQCVEQATAALTALGSGVGRRVIANGALGFVNGSVGEYAVIIECLWPKGAQVIYITFSIAGPNHATAQNIGLQISKAMGPGRRSATR